MSDVFTIKVLFFVEDAELVSLSRIKNEVDDTAKDICHLHDMFRRNVLFLAGREETVGNSADPKRFRQVCNLDDGLHAISLLVAGEHKAFERRFQHPQLGKFTGRRHHEIQLISRKQSI